METDKPKLTTGPPEILAEPQKDEGASQSSLLQTGVVNPKSSRRKLPRANESTLVPKDLAKLAINKIMEVSNLRGGELAIFWGLNPAACSMMKSGTMRLSIENVELIAKKIGMAKADFFKAVGLDCIIANSKSLAANKSKKVTSKHDSITGIKNIENKREGLNNNDWTKVNRIIQTALFTTGGIPNKEISREYFLGYLVMNLIGYGVEFVENENKIYVRNAGGEFEFEMGHIPF